MQFVTMLILIAIQYKLIQSVYSMTDTALGNAGLNSKPIFCFDLMQINDIVKGMNKVLYRNDDEVDKAMEEYAKKNIGSIKRNYKKDVIYSLHKEGLLSDKTDYYDKYLELYHKLPNTVLEYYKDKLPNGITQMDIKDDEVSKKIDEIIKNDVDTDEKVINHFVAHAQDYLVQKGTLHELNAAAIAEKVSDAKTTVHAEPEQTLINADVDTGATTHAVLHTNTEATGTDVDTGATTHAVLHTNTEATVAHAVDTSITDTPITSAGTKNDLYNKFNKYMSMLKLTEYKIPIALLSTVLGIGTIGGAYYATGSTDALDTMGSDTDTEVLNDTNDTAQRHGVCIATITACTVLLALCTTTAYWIRKKQQQDTTYTAMSMMQQTNI